MINRHSFLSTFIGGLTLPIFSLLLFCGGVLAQNRSPIPAYEGPHSLSKHRVVLCTGTSQDNFMNTNYPQAEVYRVDNITDIPTFIESGRADFGVTDLDVARAMVRLSDNFIIIDSSVYISQVAAGFSKKKPELCARFNTYLREIEQSGVKADMVNRWFNQKEPIAPTLNILKNGKPLVVGVNSGAYPFVYLSNDKIVGYEIELLARFAERENLSLQILDITFSGLINSLTSGKIDLIMSSLNITEERKKHVLFSDAYHQTPTVVIAINPNNKTSFAMPAVVASDPEKGATLADTIRTIVGDKKVAVVEGTIQELYMSNVLSMSQISIAKEYPDALLMVQSSNAGYVLCNIGVAKTYMQKDSTLEVYVPNILHVDCCFGINKNNKTLLAELNTFITELDHDGALRPIGDRWLEELDAGEMPKLKFKADGPVLRVGSACTFTPFTFIANEEHRGVDMEILYRFAHASGRRIEVVEMPFGSLMAALSTNKVDLIANMLAPTEERKKAINFTVSYYTMNSVLLGVKQGSHDNGPKESLFSSVKESFVDNLITEKRYLLVLKGLKETIILSLLSLLLGTIIGAFVCYLRMQKSTACRTVAQVYTDVMRGIPVLVLLMINYYVIFASSPLNATSVAVLSFAMNFGAYVSEMFRSSITSINKGQTEAGIAMGFTPLKTFIYIVAPQAIARVMPIYKGEAISLIKMTSIVGYIAVQDLTKVSDIIRSRTFDAFFPLFLVAVIYFLLAWVFSKLLDLLTSKITRK